MARTNAYKNIIRQDIDRINYRLKGIERLLGTESEQYRRYVNSLTATLEPWQFSLDADTGRISIKASKMSLESLKHDQLKKAAALPTAKQSIKQQKREMEKQRREWGWKNGIAVSDIEALNELNAKTYVRSQEDDKHKLKYSESVKSDMEVLGKKSYQQLKAILEKGEASKNGTTDEKKARARANSKRYYEAHKAEINARRRERRAAARGRA